MNKLIFIVDDDPLIRLIVETMISSVDNSLHFVHCENGQVGVEKLNEHLVQNAEKIIIFLDLNMPILDGWGFLDKIQSQDFNKNNLDIYILSSSIDNREIEKSKQYDLVKKFYHKPLTSVDIVEILKL